ncbi:MAG: hypothetical protein GY851_00435 [bacterium]|nr:hypothetical protein [bacterium]
MKTITGGEIVEAFQGWGPDNLISSDMDYAVPTLDWLFNVYGPWYKGEMDRYGVLKWTRKHDCDNKAEGYKFFAGVCWGQEPANKKGPEGVAVGEIHYMSSRGGHAINVAFVGEQRKLVFVEPQDQHRVALTPEERDSIWYVRF